MSTNWHLFLTTLRTSEPRMKQTNSQAGCPNLGRSEPLFWQAVRTSDEVNQFSGKLSDPRTE
ncbi:hypothetical protein [Streptococcus anginosus]|uniref:hypothetical protein n=1 Tax=Streptococcus anginosus TaxID=1328 RepID=UPI001C8CF267|nr:hypothetical protein [Streptococcus anginosus]MBX9101345.1 hypothetical protein [Streptococcus anginosus]